MHGSATTCTYCKEPFACGDCGKPYQDCTCKVYQSLHTACHKTTRHSDTRERSKRAVQASSAVSGHSGGSS